MQLSSKYYLPLVNIHMCPFHVVSQEMFVQMLEFLNYDNSILSYDYFDFNTSRL